MKNVIIFGPPGAGDVFRYHKEKQTALGLEAQKYMDKGELVPDELTIKMLKEENAKFPDAKGMLLDGFPRTVPQAEALDRILAEDNEVVDLVIQLDVSEEVVRERIAHRAKTSGRADDAEAATVERRIKEYYAKTIHVIPFYEKQDKVLKLDGEGTIDGIYQIIQEAMAKVVAE
ncbi:unnamed protein product [Cyprideis torosa]|uniref:Uncharacterized protein n=1 Tax=Cyprideis torosa TaxID=163714 RepID=A0A7R8ZT40_9CRUS|nr:unnamed protein product [Cyprideis torosa]CAG0906997.1 unnamed protein product [Cyprideis torosa]